MAQDTHSNLANGSGEPQVVVPTDWNKDRFPTSAKPIFRSVGLLVSVVLGLCYVVYYLSDDVEQSSPSATESISSPVSDLLADDDEE